MSCFLKCVARWWEDGRVGRHRVGGLLLLEEELWPFFGRGIVAHAVELSAFSNEIGSSIPSEMGRLKQLGEFSFPCRAFTSFPYSRSVLPRDVVSA